MKLIKRTYEVGGENVSLSPATISHGEIDMIGIELNIGGFVDATGGSDGESAFFSIEEFREFILECESFLRVVEDKE